MNLDVPTLFVVVSLMSLVMGLWICVMAWGQSPEDPRWAWAWSLGAFTCAQLLFGAGNLMSPRWAVTANAAAYASTLVLMLLALRRFYGLMRRSFWLWSPALLAPLSAFVLFEQLRWRVFCVSLVFMVQIALILRVLLSPKLQHQGRGRFMLVAAFAFVLVILLARLVLVAREVPINNAALGSERAVALLIVAALLGVLSNSLGFIYMIMERAERRNFELAMQDMLTGLQNRRAIADQLAMAVARARRQGQVLSVLMMDIDHFKRVNDNYGHLAGDKVLQSVAKTLQSRLREQDQIGRFGGEEFLLILPDTSLEGALTLAEDLRAAVESSPTTWEQQTIRVTISIGVWGGLISPADTADTLVGAADTAMYRAKVGG
ncbi:MAG: GGDEF domain-containing protein, partial [Burkholderiaceae bacterium]|nr:GGDEF domain-containing protein [Burkholderiaceae bacterium]